MRLFELVFMLLIGILFLYIGWRIWKRQEISLIHDYHYKKVKAADKKAYTAIIGKAMILIGSGIAMTGVICFVFHTGYGWIICGVCGIIGFAMMICAQVTYNHGLF